MGGDSGKTVAAGSFILAQIVSGYLSSLAQVSVFRIVIEERLKPALQQTRFGLVAMPEYAVPEYSEQQTTAEHEILAIEAFVTNEPGFR